MFLLAAFIYAYIAYYFSTKYFPNTSINGIDVSEKTAEEAIKNQKQLFDDYKVIISSDIMDKKEVYNQSYLILKDESEFEDIIDKQDCWKWPLHLRLRHDNEIADIEISNENINQLADQIIAENSADTVKPVDAKLQYNETTKVYDIIEAVHGSKIIKENLDGSLLSHFSQVTIQDINRKKYAEIDITNTYEQAEITGETEKLVNAREKLNKYLSTKITWKLGDKTTILDADTIHSFLSWDKKYKPKLEKTAVEDFLYQNVSKKFNTYGKTRKLKLKSGKATIKGGYYGWLVNLNKEVSQVMSDIKEGKQEERKPIFSQEARAEGENDIGDTYIDVSIDDQHVWLVHGDKTVMESDCVTGDASSGRDTPKGTFFIEYKATDYTMKKYNTHVDYWMPFNTTEGVGLHDADWRGSFGGSIYRGNGSHGCVNLPPSFAKKLYKNKYVTVGLPVIVH